MLTLRRFRAMADSYGADLRRWPEEVRGEAEAFLNLSPEARALLDEARKLDEALAAASLPEDARLWQPGEQDAALARLRSAVAARIASPVARRPARRRFGWGLAGSSRSALGRNLRWAGLATGSGFAIIAGLLVGAMYASAPEPENVLTLLQPAPIHMLAD